MRHMRLICELEKHTRKVNQLAYTRQTSTVRNSLKSSTCALAFIIRFSVKSHFTLAFNLPSVNTLPKSINCMVSENHSHQAIQINSFSKTRRPKKRELNKRDSYLWVYIISPKLIVSSWDFDSFRRLGRNLCWPHEHTNFGFHRI